MASGAIASFGTLIKMGDGASPEVFTTIAELLDIEGPELSVDMEEVTNHSSTGGFEEDIPNGILRLGEISFEVNYVPTGTTHNGTNGLIADWKNKTKRNWKIVWSDSGSTTWTGAAYVTKVNPSAPVAGVLKGSFSIKPTGVWTIA